MDTTAMPRLVTRRIYLKSARQPSPSTPILVGTSRARERIAIPTVCKSYRISIIGRPNFLSVHVLIRTTTKSQVSKTVMLCSQAPD